jgi:hypothetical protein
MEQIVPTLQARLFSIIFSSVSFGNRGVKTNFLNVSLNFLP